MRIAVVTLSLLIISCTSGNKADNPTSSAASGKKSVQLGDFEFEVDAAQEVSSATVTSASYDATTHAVKIGIDDKACEAIKHELIFSGICAESYPAQCGAAIVQPKGQKTCETSQHEDLEVALKADQDEFVLFIAAKEGKPVSVLIDREGKVKKNTTPP